MKKILPLAALLLTACAPEPVDYQAEVTPYRDGKACAISFTYDDGMLCHYTDVAPELEKRGFRGTFWIIGANMDKVEPTYPWMTWAQVAELSQRGHEIANHTWTHPSLPGLTAEQVQWELAQCDSVIAEVTGKRPISMAYPYNAMSPEVVALCEEGRVGTRLTQVGHGEVESHVTPDTLTQWLADLQTRGAWGVTMTHGTTYGWDLWHHPEWLWNFYDEVKAAEQHVWVGTFAEVCAYVKEREVAEVSIQGTTRQLTLSVTTPLDSTLFAQPLTVRVSGFDWTNKQPNSPDAEVSIVNRGDHLLVTVPLGKRVTIKN